MRTAIVFALVLSLGLGHLLSSGARAELAPPPVPPEPDPELAQEPELRAVDEAEPEVADAPPLELADDPEAALDDLAAAAGPLIEDPQTPPGPQDAAPEAEPNDAPDDAPDDAIAQVEAVLAQARALGSTDFRSERATEALPADLAWLAGASLPSFAVRWDDRLIAQLHYYRDDPRGRELAGALIARAGRYEALIRETLDAQGLPQDLLYVAMVESGFDPQAKSPVGAVGMWQLIEATGLENGLTIDRWVDERLSPERATEAAARFLKDLHAKLGAWPLAFAAYNMGHNGLLRSIRKYNTNDIVALARAEAGLPYETIQYVAKVTALSIVGRNPGLFGLGHVSPEPSAELSTIDVPGGLSLGRLARAAGIEVEALVAHNPELLRTRVPPDVKLWSLRVPSERTARLRERLPALTDGDASFGRHVLRFGERLRDVAAAYGTSDTKLRALNDLPQDAEAMPGSTLLVPDVEPTFAQHEGGEIVVALPALSFDEPERKRVYYAVQPGDSLLGVAAFFGVTLPELQRWNDVEPDAALQPGMVLQLFVARELDLSSAITLAPERVRPVVVGSEEFFAHHEGQRDRVRIRYHVRGGDTLESLGERYDLSPGSIARINGFSRYTKLQSGTEIILYVPASEAARAARTLAQQVSPRSSVP